MMIWYDNDDENCTIAADSEWETSNIGRCVSATRVVFGRWYRTGTCPRHCSPFATENSPKCTISRVKILFVAKLSPSLVSTTNTTLAVVLLRRLTARCMSSTTWVCRASQSANWSSKWTTASTTYWGSPVAVRTALYNWTTGPRSSNTHQVG